MFDINSRDCDTIISMLQAADDGACAVAAEAAGVAGVAGAAGVAGGAGGGGVVVVLNEKFLLHIQHDSTRIVSLMYSAIAK